MIKLQRQERKFAGGEKDREIYPLLDYSHHS